MPALPYTLADGSVAARLPNGLLLVAVALGAALVTWVFTRKQLVSADEAWQLVVADRVRNRLDVLYRDVSFDAGPLPVWLLSVSLRSGGVEARTLRATNAMITGVLAAGLVVLAGVAALPNWMAAALVAATVLGCGPVADREVVATNLSRAGMVVAAAGVVHGTPWAVSLAGAAVGVAVLSAPRAGLVGAAALVALTVASNVAGWAAVAAVGALTAVVALGTAPLAVHEGGVRAMLVHLRSRPSGAASHGLTRRWIDERRRGSILLLMMVVPLAVGALALSLVTWSDDGAGRDTVLVVWAVAAWLAITGPWRDTASLRRGLPFAAFAAAVALDRAGDVWSVAWLDIAKVGFGWWVVWVALLGTAHARHLGSRGPGGAVHGCRGARCPVPDDTVEHLAEAHRVAGGRAIVLGRDAPVAYLVSGIHDPTPFDHPLLPHLGFDGQRRMVDSLESGRVHHVVELLPLPDGDDAPTIVDEWVQAHSELVWQHGLVRLRRVRP